VTVGAQRPETIRDCRVVEADVVCHEEDEGDQALSGEVNDTSGLDSALKGTTARLDR
jgi:hypothetical protein